MQSSHWGPSILVAMASSRDAREPGDGRPEYKARGSHEPNHDRTPTSLPDGRRRPFDKVTDASLGARAGKPCPGREDAQEVSPVFAARSILVRANEVIE
jgi:hypothetical protein